MLPNRRPASRRTSLRSQPDVAAFWFRQRTLAGAVSTLLIAGCASTTVPVRDSSAAPPAQGPAPASDPASAPAQDEGSGDDLSLREALAKGKASVRSTYRFENVDDDLFDDPARSSTLRNWVAYDTARFQDVRARIAFENVVAVGNDLYNSTINGVTDRPVVPDPEGSELEEAWLAWDGEEDLEVKIGRQVIQLGNLRFVGDVAWRQNHQTFDAIRLDWKAPTDTKVFAAYVHNVNRIFGEDSPIGDSRSDTLLFQVEHAFRPEANLRAYGFLLDDDSLPGNSTNTFGARLDGRIPATDEVTALYTAELAVQSDNGDNPNDVDSEYFLGELGAAFPAVTAKLSLEQLGGSGDPGDAFQTPLSTLHKFNGWADRFLVTPDDGLVDLHLALTGKARGAAWRLVYHDFSADSGGSDYGTEIDAQVVRPINDWITLGVKAAFYDADDFSEDVNRFWIWLAFAP